MSTALADKVLYRSAQDPPEYHIRTNNNIDLSVVLRLTIPIGIFKISTSTNAQLTHTSTMRKNPSDSAVRTPPSWEPIHQHTAYFEGLCTISPLTPTRATNRPHEHSRLSLPCTYYADDRWMAACQRSYYSNKTVQFATSKYCLL